MSSDLQGLSLQETTVIKINDLLYKAIPGSVIATIAIAATLSGVLLPFYSNTILILWFLVVTSINMARYVLYRFYISQKDKLRNAKGWDKHFYYLLILNGLCFSIVGLAFLPDATSSYHYFPIMVLIGLATGAVSSLSFSLRNISTYFILLLAPVFFGEIMINTPLSYSIAGLILLAMIFSLVNAKRIYQTSIENIKLNFLSEKHTQELIESRNAAIAANGAKSNFVSMISHELRTPLNGMLGYAQLLQMSDNPPLNNEQKENNNNIIESGKYLLSLIEELLDLSNIESHKLKVDIVPVSLSDILDGSLAITKPVAKQYDIEIITKVEQAFLVKADAKRLKQIFINLISNAVKYNNEHGKITININKIANNKVKVSVTDTGEGLTKDQIDGLFIPFQRYNKQKEGLGLGLYIAQNLIELMDGNMGVESVVGEGSTFWFSVPLAED